MSEYKHATPDRHEGWSMADEGYEKVTRISFYGDPYEVWQKIDRRPDLGQLWAKWRAQQQWLPGDGTVSEHERRRHETIIDKENQGL